MGDSTFVTISYFVLHIFSGKPNSKCLLTVLNSDHDGRMEKPESGTGAGNGTGARTGTGTGT